MEKKEIVIHYLQTSLIPTDYPYQGITEMKIFE